MDRPNRLPPNTVIAYAAIFAGTWLIAFAHEGASRPLLNGGLVLALGIYGLWRGLWIAWLLLLVLAHLCGLAVVLLEWQSSWFVAVALVLHGVWLGLLAARPTRRHARRGRPRLA